MYASITKTTIVTLALAGLAVSAPHPQAYPDKCGDMVCPSDKPLCCGVPYNGAIGLECMAGKVCPPIPTVPWHYRDPHNPKGGIDARQAEPRAERTAPPIPSPTFGPKCGDSFFCKPGQVCCTLYTCADTPEQCPPQ